MSEADRQYVRHLDRWIRSGSSYPTSAVVNFSTSVVEHTVINGCIDLVLGTASSQSEPSSLWVPREFQ